MNPSNAKEWRGKSRSEPVRSESVRSESVRTTLFKPALLIAMCLAGSFVWAISGPPPAPSHAQSDELDLRGETFGWKALRAFTEPSLLWSTIPIFWHRSMRTRIGQAYRWPLSPAWGSSVLVMKNHVDLEAKRAFFAASLLGDVPAIEGDTVLATIQFERLQLEVPADAAKLYHGPPSRSKRCRSTHAH